MSMSGSRPASQARSVSSLRPASASGVDLDVSHLSQYSTGSTGTMCLGGSEYPVGAVIGSSGKFVIGDPGTYSKKSQSTPSINTTTSIRQLIVSRGYDFEDWNWPVIRFSCVLLLVAVMIALLAAVIGLSVQSRLQCNIQWQWWQGSVMYRINTPDFHDGLLRDQIGDVVGVVNQLSYLTTFLGVNILMMKNFLPAETPGLDFSRTKSFVGVDDRMGTLETLVNLVEELQKKGVKLMVEIDAYSTSEQHEWYMESRVQSQTVGSVYKNVYVWRDQPQGEARHWVYDRVRNQYYYTGNQTARPVVDWGNQRVHELFGEVIDFWLERGVDGIYLSNLDNWYGIDDATVVSMLDSWKPILDKHRYVDGVRKRNPQHLKYVLENIQLVDTPILTSKENGSADLQRELEEKMWIQQLQDGPWTCWHWTNMSNLAGDYWAAMEMFLLSIPGTPSIINGQEIGRDPEAAATSDGKPAVMSWLLETIPAMPYQSGSQLDVSTLQPFSRTIQLRQKKGSLRSAGEEMGEDGSLQQQPGYLFHLDDAQQVLMERYFRMQDKVFYLAYFGKLHQVEYDWSFLTGVLHVIVDTEDKLSNDIKLNKLILTKGQAIIASLPK